MAVTDTINRRVQRLSDPLRTEVLHFVDYLLARSQREDEHLEDQSWLGLSLQSAMRGLKTEDEPEYSESDLRERFS